MHFDFFQDWHLFPGDPRTHTPVPLKMILPKGLRSAQPQSRTEVCDTTFMAFNGSQKFAEQMDLQSNFFKCAQDLRPDIIGMVDTRTKEDAPP